MAKILKKTQLNDTVFSYVFDAPLIAKKAQPGQFVIIRVDEEGERIPLTISDYDREKGTITLVVQVIGSTTKLLSMKHENEDIATLVGPLGNPSNFENVRSACVIGGGVGCAIAYPVLKELKEKQVDVDAIIGFRNKELVILEEDFKNASNEFYLMTDDGSAGEKGLVTHALKRQIEKGKQYDVVFAVGPLPMMKFVSLLTKEYNIKTVVSMNPIMIDGTGMCGGCRLTVDNKVKFACIDGPDFDAHLVDFDEVIKRSRMYQNFERHAHEDTCNLFKKEEQA